MGDTGGNVLTETLDEIYDNVEMQGGYLGLKEMLSGILEDCECDNPTADIQVQFDGMIEDLELLKERLLSAVKAKMVPAQAPKLG